MHSKLSRRKCFVGKLGYYSDDTGLDLLEARYYVPGLGRFLTQDPIGHQGGLNLYQYCGNNPLTRTDPDGKDWDAQRKALTLGGYEFTGGGILASLKTIVNAGMEQAAWWWPKGRVSSDPGYAEAHYGWMGLETLLSMGASSWAGPSQELASVARATAIVRYEGQASWYSSHLLERMAQRGITPKMVDAALRNGERYWDPLNKSVAYVLRNGTKQGGLLIGRNPITGKLTTAINGSKALSTLKRMRALE